MAPPLRNVTFRVGTPDREIYRSVVEKNEYRLSGRLTSKDIVIDIGAHIGSFSIACLLRDAGFVYSVEVASENVMLLRNNLFPFQGRVCIIHGAVWRSDMGSIPLHYDEFPKIGGIPNTGGTDVVFGKGSNLVQSIPLDELLEQATARGITRIRLMKIDAECSEWPILLTSKRLCLVDEICGEFHEMGGEYDCHVAPFTIGSVTRFTAEILEKLLREQGFATVTIERKVRMEDGKPASYGLFFAKRRTILRNS